MLLTVVKQGLSMCLWGEGSHGKGYDIFWMNEVPELGSLGYPPENPGSALTFLSFRMFTFHPSPQWLLSPQLLPSLPTIAALGLHLNVLAQRSRNST